jgi:transposase
MVAAIQSPEDATVSSAGDASRHSDDVKLDAVLYAQTHSRKEAALKFNVCSNTIGNWMHQLGAVKRRRSRAPRVTPATLDKIIKELAAGNQPKVVAKRVGVSYVTMARIMRGRHPVMRPKHRKAIEDIRQSGKTSKVRPKRREPIIEAKSQSSPARRLLAELQVHIATNKPEQNQHLTKELAWMVRSVMRADGITRIEITPEKIAVERHARESW